MTMRAKRAAHALLSALATRLTSRLRACRARQEAQACFRLERGLSCVRHVCARVCVGALKLRFVCWV